MKSKRPTAYPRAVGNMALAEIVEEHPVWVELAIDYPSDPSRDNFLSAATWILMGIGLSALLWGFISSFSMGL
ncbi:MAG: hypothetical protein HXY51_14385 [Nitrospirae bacterium]|nr:hypothetical protein [Nitrospirota bacterium]